MGKKKGASGGGKAKGEKELTKAQRIEAKKAKQAQKGLKKDRKQLGADEEDIELLLLEFMKKDAARTQVTVARAPQPSPRANFTMAVLPSGELLQFGGEYFDGAVNECYNDLFRWNLDAISAAADSAPLAALQDEAKDGEEEAEEEDERPAMWKSISSPNTPPPRCSHQSVVYRDHLYVFGGEFATADQFHHYRDFWRLDLKTNSWEALDDKGGPSPRSGHRMVVWRNYLVVFGGFYEAARETKWFNDVFIFNFADMKWKKCTFSPHRQMPAPRSGCQLAVHPSKDLIFVYGGYAKVKNVGEKSEGKVYADLWVLNMAPVLKRQDPTWEKLSRKGQAPSPRGGAAVTVHKQRFILFGGVFDEEKRRHTMQSTFYNDLFVYDMDRRRWFEFKLRGKKKEGEGKRRRKKKAANGDDEGLDDGADDDENDEEEEEEEEDFDKMLEKQFGYVDEHGNIVYLEDEDEEEEEKKEEQDTTVKMEHSRVPDDAELFGDEDESKEQEKEDVAPAPAASFVAASVPKKEEQPKEEEEEPIPAPCPRINPAITIRGSTLYVYGGVVEDGDREITLDDLWSLNLNKLDEWKLLLPGTMSEQEWRGEVSETEESSDGDEDDDDDDDDDEDDDEDELEVEEGRKREKKAAAQAAAVERAVEMLADKDEGDDESEEKKKKKKSKKKSSSKTDRRAIRAEMEKLQEQLELDDANRTPQMGENLRDFFARTATYWATQIAQRPDTEERQLSVKEIKREGFAMAEVRYNELLPVLERLNVLEQEQKEAEELYQKKKGKDKSRR